MPDGKNVILAAYYFPPLGMGGVGRPYALFRHLPDYGYNILVLTVKNILYPEYDHSLLRPGDESRIYRSGSFDPARLLYLAGFRKQRQVGFPGLSRRIPIYFPDLKRGWNLPAYQKLKKIVKHHKIAAVITTAPPPSVHLMGLKIKRETGIPWIADFRDYWFPLPIEKIYALGIMRDYAAGLKSRIQKNADEIVSVNNDIRDYFGRGEVIMNAADETVVQQWQGRRNRNQQTFIIGALGTFNYLFPIEPLFKAVRRIIDHHAGLQDKIKITHVGHCDDTFYKLIDKYALRKNVILNGYQDRAGAIEALLNADFLYLAVNRFDKFNILPGRIFDYLVSGKPILGLVPPDSDAEALLAKYPLGCAITDGDEEKVFEYIEEKLDEKTRTGYGSEAVTIETEEYSMPALARKYASVLDNLLK